MGWFTPVSTETALSPGPSQASRMQGIIARFTKKEMQHGHEPEKDKFDVMAYKQCMAGLDELKRDKEMPSAFYKEYHFEEIDRAAARAFEKAKWPGFHPYQNDGIGLLGAGEDGRRGNVTGSILADEMGLGKTVQTIAHMLQNRTPRGEPTLIVSDLIVLQNWQDEFRRWLSPCLKLAAMGPWLSADIPIVKSIEEFKKYDVVFCTYQKISAEFSVLKTYCDSMLHRRNYPYPAREARQTGTQKKPKVIDLNLARPPNLAIFRMLWGRVILDESHKINKSTSKASMGCRSLRARWRLSISGTPQQNDYSDVLSQFQFMGLVPFNNDNWFRTHFLNKQKEEKDDEGKLMKLLRKEENTAKLRAHEHPQLEATRNVILFLAILPISIRRTANGKFLGKTNLELPDMKVEDIYIDLDDGDRYHKWMKNKAKQPGVNKGVDLQAVRKFFDLVKTHHPKTNPNPFKGCDADTIKKLHKHYPTFSPATEQETQFISRQQWSEPWRDAVHSTYNKIPGDKRRVELSIITRAITCCFHPAAILPRPLLQEFLNTDPQNWKSSKSVHAANLIREGLKGIRGKDPLAPNDKWVVVSSSLRVLDIMAFALDQYGIQSLRLDGETPNELRPDICDRFNNDGPGSPSVLLMSSRVGAAGIKLIGASEMVVLSPDWNPETDRQAMKRIHRMGQSKPVTVYRYWARNSIDMRVLARQIAKKNKNYGIMDLFLRPLSELTPTQRQLREDSDVVLEDMKGWSQDRFLREVRFAIAIVY
jgi:DNA repair protein RAD16